MFTPTDSSYCALNRTVFDLGNLESDPVRISADTL